MSLINILWIKVGIMLSLDRKRLKSLGIIGGAVVLLGAGGFALYQYIWESQNEEDTEVTAKYTSKPITIILTDSIISSNLPIKEILLKTENLVVVIPPNLSIKDLNEEIDETISYKVIECSTNEGVWSVVKHLNSEVIFVVNDDLEEELPENLQRYVGDIIELEQNFSYINQKILSYVIH